MLKRDYILRLIREFAEALELVMKKDVSKQRDEIRLMYDQYVGPYSLYHICTMDEVMDSFERFPPEERAERMEMLAELYYAEAGLMAGIGGDELLQRAFALFDFIDRHDKTFSIARRTKMADIQRRLEQSAAGAAD